MTDYEKYLIFSKSCSKSGHSSFTQIALSFKIVPQSHKMLGLLFLRNIVAAYFQNLVTLSGAYLATYLRSLMQSKGLLEKENVSAALKV